MAVSLLKLKQVIKISRMDNTFRNTKNSETDASFRAVLKRLVPQDAEG